MAWLIIGLLTIDAALIAGAFGHSVSFGVFASEPWRIGSDRGLGELWFDAKLLLAATILLKSSRRAPVLGGIAAIVILLVVDDLFSAHQFLGQAVADGFDFGRHLGMRPVDLGELIVFFAYGTVLVAVMVLMWRASSTEGRFGGLVMAVSLVVVAFFGVVLDAAHSARYTEGWAAVLDDVLALLEDGGEIVGATVVVVAALVARGPCSPSTDDDRVAGFKSG